MVHNNLILQDRTLFCYPNKKTEEKILVPVVFPSFLVTKMLELRHRRVLDALTIDSIQISPRLFEPRDLTKPQYGMLPVLFRLPNTWTLKITVPSPLTYTLTVVGVQNALHIYERIQNRAFFSVQQLLTTYANQTLWGAHMSNTWNEERIRYKKTDNGRLEPWNRRFPDTTDSGADSLADAEFGFNERNA